MAKRESGRLMLESEIPAFVDAVIEAGCDICAIGHDCYVLGDLEEMDAAADELDRIGEVFGDRDFLLLEIVAYLRSLGRSIEPGPSPGHWTENGKAH
ncbi:hypothetical protein GOA99_22870 [Sinorhizobium meliloti]|uniref:hypothetical protein n=1 Tax=Sinorhizobium TaxID=28105 RepID=UPI000FD746F9|nr:hypothetical protein [Sinorhizobium meliloti]GCA52818.1 hypothetical protein KGO5_05284 [Sinorhizobium sp. KGO-5]MDW9364152.1 hypothetical protein [Sinorhizobium meliloti]MDW9387470.1 hypothetical protein [Sinorhizobium meliloti]MDW9602105.1 hypothetical protein [Sinorhizobium meliloti]MQV06806.1 hypothetical protein [Sinorhizobium meliloti]